jgi:hypothetical protein
VIVTGHHTAVCEVIQFSDPKEGEDLSKAQVVIGFRIIDEDGPDRGHMIAYYGGLADAKEGKEKGPYDWTLEALRAIGWEGCELLELPELAFKGLLKTPVGIVVDHEEWEGKWRAKVKFVNRLGGAIVKRPMSGDNLKALSARMKDRLKADAAKRPKVVQPSPSTNGNTAPHPNAPGVRDEAPPPSDDNLGY